MDLNKLLSDVPDVKTMAAALEIAAKTHGGITLSRSVIGRTQDTIFIAGTNRHIYEVPLSSVVSMKKVEPDEPLETHFLDSPNVYVRLQKGTLLKETRILEVGIDAVDPQPPSGREVHTLGCNNCPNGSRCCDPRPKCVGTHCEAS